MDRPRTPISRYLDAPSLTTRDNVNVSFRHEHGIPHDAKRKRVQFQFELTQPGETRVRSGRPHSLA
jgi:hypothetical protein